MKKAAEKHVISYYGLVPNDTARAAELLEGDSYIYPRDDSVSVASLYESTTNDLKDKLIYNKPYQHPCGSAIISEQFFQGANSFVFRHKDMFTSIIPKKSDELEASAPMVCLVMTVVSLTF
jgi:hypothetical protein